MRDRSGSPCPRRRGHPTDNTAIITDPAAPRLRTRLTRFDHEVRGIIRAHGAKPGSSTLLDGVFWSDELKQTTYERSRAFEVNRVDPAGLRHIADVIRKQYHQESVLTFRCLPRDAPDTDAVEIQAPGVSPTRLHDALLADLPLAKKLTAELGVDWDTAEVRYGDEEFVG
ncbi:hypothetical protein ACE1OC_03565 [Streptomyces sp. DSM 116496]|uniref:hypothetical protein n=1 Tax=Streptomyces stoeckheimensis TaxID=3344656 RepID=UPI0038B2F8DA